MPLRLQAPVHRRASRTDTEGRLTKDALMKKRLLITGLVFAALLLALYGVVFGTEELRRLYGPEMLLIGSPVSQDDPDDDDAEPEEATILGDVVTREEFLALPDDISFPQPKRPTTKPLPDEENG
jgi:hypothetical protein